MKTATCLILEPSDLTRAKALKPAAFAAFATHDVVLSPEGTVMKISTPSSSIPRKVRSRQTSPRPAQSANDPATTEGTSGLQP